MDSNLSRAHLNYISLYWNSIISEFTCIRFVKYNGLMNPKNSARIAFYRKLANLERACKQGAIRRLCDQKFGVKITS